MSLDLSEFTDYLSDEEFTDCDPSGRWQLTYRLGVTKAGRVAIRELRISERMTADAYYGGRWKEVLLRRVPDGGVTTRLLRSLQMEPLRQAAANHVYEQSRGRRVPTGIKSTARRADVKATRGRPQVLGMSFYRQVAARWKALVDARDPHRDKTLASEFNRSRSGMAGVIRRCRDKGLIPATTIAPRVAGARRRGRRAGPASPPTKMI